MSYKVLFNSDFLIAVAPTMLSDMNQLPTVQLGSFTLQLELDALSPEVSEIARKELRETPEVTKDAVEKLRELLKRKQIIILYYNYFTARFCDRS